MDTLAFFYMMISHSAEYTILFIQFVSIVTSSYHKKKNPRMISGGEGVINVDRVVINMSSLCLETEIKMPILFLIIYEGVM